MIDRNRPVVAGDIPVKLVVIVKVANRVENSFISKYLHFHFPESVPIFDSYAYDVSWQLAAAPTSEQRACYDKRVNWKYAYHCGALLEIMSTLQKYGVKLPSLKLIDVLLYGTR